MKPRFVRLSLLAIVAGLGCYAVEEPEARNELASVDREIENALADGATIVWSAASHATPSALRSVTWALRDGGSLVVPYYRGAGEDVAVGLPLAIAVQSNGRALPLVANGSEAVFSVSEGAPPPSVTPCGDEAVVRLCAAEPALWVTRLEEGRIVRSHVALGACESTVLGQTLAGERFVTLGVRDEVPVLTEWSCSGGEIREASEPRPLPEMPALPRWIGEVEPSVFAWVRHEPDDSDTGYGDWVYERSDGQPPLRIARTDLPFPAEADVARGWERVRREPSGALLVDGISGLYRWNVGGSGEVELIGNLPPPSTPGVSGWEHTGFGTAIAELSDWNPSGTRLSMPLAYEVLRSTAEGYRVAEAPSTACSTREACRRIGESYLRGLVETEGGPLGLYLLWTWQFQPVPYGETTASGRNVAALMLAPLDRPPR